MNTNNFMLQHFQLVKKENLVFTKWCKKYNLLYMDTHMLLSIDESHGVSEPTKLSEELLIPKQSITSMLDKLEKKGYIKRTHSADDRRKVNISLTDEGIKIVKKVRQAINNAEQEILKEIKQEKLDEMLKTYEQIIDITKSNLLGEQDD